MIPNDSEKDRENQTQSKIAVCRQRIYNFVNELISPEFYDLDVNIFKNCNFFCILYSIRIVVSLSEMIHEL